MLLRYPFGGKGSPEGIQAVLQLAATVGPSGEAPIITTGFQKYCDDNLGTDCNGFVGNFILHEVHGKHWSDVEAEGEIGPQTRIDDLVRKASGVTRNEVGEINFADFNILAQVNDNGDIVPGGKPPHGHITISEPGMVHRMMPIWGRWVDCPACPDGTGVPGVWIVESTGGHGLAKSWYHIFAHPKASTNIRWKGVFRMHRGVKNKMWNCRVKALIA